MAYMFHMSYEMKIFSINQAPCKRALTSSCILFCCEYILSANCKFYVLFLRVKCLVDHY